jgi:hypothetical protein
METEKEIKTKNLLPTPFNVSAKKTNVVYLREYVSLMLKENGGPFDEIEDSIVTLFGHLMFDDTHCVGGSVYVLDRDMTNTEIVKEINLAEPPYHITNALKLLNELASILNQDVGTRVYLKEQIEHEGEFYHATVCMYANPNGKLILSIGRIIPQNFFYEGERMILPK